MKTLFALLALSVSTAAFSACYLIYTPNNELVWQGATPPVPMNATSISNEVQKLVPKGHMVITEDASAPCHPLDLTTPNRTMRQKAKEIKYD